MNVYKKPNGARAIAAYWSLRMDGVRAIIAADLVASLEYHRTNAARHIALRQTLGAHGLTDAMAEAWLKENGYQDEKRYERPRRVCRQGGAR